MPLNERPQTKYSKPRQTVRLRMDVDVNMAAKFKALSMQARTPRNRMVEKFIHSLPEPELTAKK